MRRRTVTKQNGASDDSEREMHFGLDVIGTVGAFVIAAFAAWLSLNLKVGKIETIQEEGTKTLPLLINVAVETHDDLKDYVTRTDFERSHPPTHREERQP